EDVVCLADVRDPVAHGFADGFLERCLSGGYRDDCSSEELHAGYVEGLSLHVDGSHVDDALHAEARGDGGCGNAVLACAGLRDDPLFAHPAGKEDLAEGVVDLMSAGVEQVFALEVDLGTAEGLGK